MHARVPVASDINCHELPFKFRLVMSTIVASKLKCIFACEGIEVEFYT